MDRADVSYNGTHFKLDRAQCDPKPIQGRPEVLIGGGGEKLTLRVVARLADASNFGGKPHESQHKARCFAQHCKDVGRDYDEIRRPGRRRCSSERPSRRCGKQRRQPVGEPFESWQAGNLVGTPEQVAEKIKAYVALGCTGFYPWCSDYPDTETLHAVRTAGDPAVP